MWHHVGVRSLARQQVKTVLYVHPDHTGSGVVDKQNGCQKLPAPLQRLSQSLEASHHSLMAAQNDRPHISSYQQRLLLIG